MGAEGLRPLFNPYSPKETFRHRIARTSGALPFDHVNESFFINGGGSCRNVESRGSSGCFTRITRST